MGLVGAFCQAAGIGMAKVGMDHGCEPLESAFIRISSAAVLTAIYFFVWKADESNTQDRNRFTNRSLLEPIQEWDTMKKFLPATLCGTWLGIWLFQIAQKGTDTAVVSTLVSTCPIFAIPLVWWLQKQTVSLKGILGTIVAVLGVALIVLWK